MTSEQALALAMRQVELALEILSVSIALREANHYGAPRRELSWWASEERLQKAARSALYTAQALGLKLSPSEILPEASQPPASSNAEAA